VLSGVESKGLEDTVCEDARDERLLRGTERRGLSAVAGEVPANDVPCWQDNCDRLPRGGEKGAV